MKANSRTMTAGLLGCAALFAVGHVSANDLDMCRAGYKMLLMTPVECKTYLRSLRAAQAKSDHVAVVNLQEWHTQLLIERSQACPCEFKPATMQSARMISSNQ